MLARVSDHYIGIKTQSEKKYRILAEAQRKGSAIGFDVLYYAQSKSRQDIDNEIGAAEGRFIRKLKPRLNT